MSNVVWIEEWLRRKEEREWQRRLRFHIHRNGGRCWYPVRDGELEWERVYGVAVALVGLMLLLMAMSV